MRPGTMAREGAMFGLAVEGTIAVHGLAPAAGTAGRRVALRRTSRAEIETACPRERGALLGGVGTGRRAVIVTTHEERGYVWRAPGFGLFRVALDGSSIECGPTRGPAWWWQRMLIGQATPHAALIHGLEVLHAGAVGVRGGAVALTGESGAGKSTLVAALVDRGATFLADDVVAVEPAADSVLAHPGAAVMSLRAGAIPPPGRVIGADEEGQRIEVVRGAQPLPIHAVLVLTRSAGPTFQELDPTDPRPLLAATFNRAVLDPERVGRQHDVCARIAASARLLRVHVDVSGHPARLADAILDEVA